MNILEKIITDKKEEVLNDKQNLKLSEIKKKINKKKFKFIKQLKKFKDNNKIAVIAEIKKASPSKGILKEDFNHLSIAKQYFDGGAACLSILTEKKHFLGNKQFVTDIKKNFEIPILNKDFFVDPYQVFEANKNGADCILIIINSSSINLIKELIDAASETEMDVLLEVHNEKEMEIALDFPNTIIGINNRNLENFNVDINNTIRIYKNFENSLKEKTLVCESGIFAPNDIQMIKRETNINNFLIGESLMKSQSIKNTLSSLIK